MIIDVTQFNRTRNKLAWKLDTELLMLREEIREFWDAETTAERVDAYIDTRYVWLGTRIKASYNTVPLPIELVSSIDEAIALMYDYLVAELGENATEIIIAAERIVCQANSIKGSKLDENGKVLKDKAYKEAIDATKQIAFMVEDITKPKSY